MRACVREGVYACVKAINRRRAIRANLILGGTNDSHLYCLRLSDLCFSVDRHGGCCWCCCYCCWCCYCGCWYAIICLELLFSSWHEVYMCALIPLHRDHASPLAPRELDNPKADCSRRSSQVAVQIYDRNCFLPQCLRDAERETQRRNAEKTQKLLIQRGREGQCGARKRRHKRMVQYDNITRCLPVLRR